MADAKKCDRCKKFYERYNEECDEKKINAIVRANLDIKRKYWPQGIIELCPECMNEFNDWMKNSRKSKHNELPEKTSLNNKSLKEFQEFMMQRFMKKE